MSWRTKPDPIGESRITASYEADIVVVGLGYAGGAALRAAAEGGASVIGIELMPEERYRSFGRDIGHINSQFLASRGVPGVDPIDLFNEWMKRAGGRANPRLVMQYCRNCGEAFDWYTEMYGTEGLKDLHVAFWPEGGERHKAAAAAGDPSVNGYSFWVGTAQFPDPMCWPGSPTLQDCAKANLDLAREKGARVFYGHSAEQMVMDGDRATGVIAGTKAGEYIRCLAKKAVVLAAGDFSGNREMLEELCCDIADLLAPGDRLPPSFGRKGRGHQLGVWAGGRLEARPLPAMGGNTVTPMGPCTFGALWLDRDGRRWCNEVFGGTEIAGFPGNQMPRGEMFCVFDEHFPENELQWATPSHGGFDANIPNTIDMIRSLAARSHASSDGRLEAVLAPPMNKPVPVFCGRTPEELVKNAGLKGTLAENIIASIRRYNELCAAGRDEDFGRDPRLLDPLTDMLFLQRVSSMPIGQMLVSVGGLVTDEHQQVLNDSYERIDGLYATGNCCGRRFGPQYSSPIPGVSIGIAITLGRELGKHLASL